MGLSASNEDYLRALWKLEEWSGEPSTPTVLARSLGLSPSTVTEGIRRMAAKGLVHHYPYGTVRLTDAGLAEAARMVRAHRIIETALVSLLGYPWDEVDAEAERLEHAASEALIARLDERLGYPDADPHGAPIPRPGSASPREAGRTRTLAAAPAGVEAVVTHVAQDPEVLRAAAACGIRVGTPLTVCESSAEGVRITLQTGESHTVPVTAATAVCVEPRS